MRSSSVLGTEHLLQLSPWLATPDTDEQHEADISAVAHLLDCYAVDATVSTLLSDTTTAETNVALQFPDSLLHHAPLITEALSLVAEIRTANLPDDSPRSFLFFVLGDTSYGECCVDEVAAQHLATHLVIHYGNSCLSPTRTLPALYVFPQTPLSHTTNVTDNLRRTIERTLAETGAAHLVLLYDLDLCSYFTPSSFEPSGPHSPLKLSSFAAPVSAARLAVPNAARVLSPATNLEHSQTHRRIGPHVFDTSPAPIEETAFLWLTGPTSIGTEQGPTTVSNAPTSVQHAALALCTGPGASRGVFIHPLSSESDCAADDEAPPRLVDASLVLRRRFAKLRHIEAATRIAIVPGTLGASGATAAIERCKRVVRAAGKHPFVLLVGKPNPAKLANFAEMDVFVLVACPYTALLDGRDYMRPIVTPLELEAALTRDGDLFSIPYSTDWRELASTPENLPQHPGESDDTRGALVPREEWHVATDSGGSAAEFLKQRMWQGLKFDKGGQDNDTDVNDLPVVAEQRQTGRASVYDREVKPNKTGDEKRKIADVEDVEG